VLETRDELVEVETSAFVTEQATVGTVDMGAYTVQVRLLQLHVDIGQVCPMLVCLVHAGRRVQDVPLELAFPVRRVVHAEPYVLLLTDNAHIILLELADAKGEGPSLDAHWSTRCRPTARARRRPSALTQRGVVDGGESLS